MLDCLQMHCSTKKGSLEPWAQLCARAERFGRRLQHTEPWALLCRWGQQLWSWHERQIQGRILSGESCGQRWEMSSWGGKCTIILKQQGNTAWAARMSKQDNYQEFTEVLLQSWNGFVWAQRRRGGARNKILVKNGNDKDFRVILIDMKNRGRRKSIN